MSSLQLRITELTLPLVHTFTIARGSEDTATTALFRLQWGEFEGLGEAAPIARYDESVASVRAYFEANPVRGSDPYRLEALLADIPPAARCGLDFALHDLIGKDLERPLWRLLGLDPAATPLTSFTIGIDDIPSTIQKVREVGEHPILKIKLGRGNEIETLEAVRSIFTGTIRIDANEGWTPEQAVSLLSDMARLQIEFCEQPIAAGNPAALRWIRERAPIPIVTDEDSVSARDLYALVGCVDGVNVKLAKCGGIRAALGMIATARALGFKVMLGCMVESAIAATAAAHLSPLVDWADIDGPFLVRDDPFRGVTYDRGKLILPNAPGLGVIERAVAA